MATLFKDDPVVTTNEDIPVADIDNLIPGIAEIVTQPTSAFCENVAQLGVLVPVLLIKRSRGNKYDIAEGRRRIIAAKKAGLATIPARIFPAGYSKKEVVTLAANDQRKPNIVDEYKAVEKLLANGDEVDDIVAKTGVPKKKILTLLLYRDLVPELKKGFEDGSIRPAVALRAAKQKKPVQRKLVTVYQEQGTLYGTDISDVRKDLKSTVVEGLPSTLFDALPDDWKDRAYYALTSLKGQIESKAPAEFLGDLDSLLQQTKRND